jgi:hypothetical protein
MTRKEVEIHLDMFGMWNRKGNLRAAAVELEAAMRALLDLVDPTGAKPVATAPESFPVISGSMHIDLTKLAAENTEEPAPKAKPRARSRKPKVTAAPKRTRTKKEA